MSKEDSKVIADKVRSKKRFDKRDFGHVAEFIHQEYERRKSDRNDRERSWNEVDRQLRMEPDISHKIQWGTEKVDPTKEWLAEVELPLQSQTLEVLTADSRRMKFPDSGIWFKANANLSDEYLDRADFRNYISGDENEVPSALNQDNANKIVEGLVAHWERQYDFFGHMDKIDAEAFKYGTGVGVARVIKKRIVNDPKGNTRGTTEIPVLVPRSIRNTYLDNAHHALMIEGHHVGPGHIFSKKIKVADLKMAAFKGSNDPNRMDGGWMPRFVKNLVPDERGEIKLLEFEGDLVVPRRTTGDMFFPGCIVTVVVDGGHTTTVRWRFTPFSFNTHIIFPYHPEHVDDPYSTSPLVKGYPIQASAAQILGRLLELGALHSQPPISYDKDSMHFAAGGGPRVYPGAQWPTMDDINVFDKIGDAGALFNLYIGLLQQYADVTGVNAPRLGAQTVSHTTAFAKEAELNRGTIRTVDYVRSSLKGPMTQWLFMAYQMGRSIYRRQDYFLPGYKGFVSVPKAGLPDEVVFEAHGSGAPSEEQQRIQNRLASLQTALQMEQLDANMAQIAQATGKERIINIAAAIEEVLKDGGWQDTDAILGQQSAGGSALGPQVGGPPQVAGPTAAPGAALAALAAGTGGL